MPPDAARGGRRTGGTTARRARRASAPREGRRLPRHLAVRGDHCALAVAVAPEAVVARHQVAAQLVLDQLARRTHEAALVVAAVDRLVEARIEPLAARVLGREERGVRADPRRRIEQDEPLDAVGRDEGDLVRDLAAPGVAEPRERLVGDRAHEVGHLLLEAPGRLPCRVAVTPQVRCQHAPAQALGQGRKEAAVPSDPVQADQRRRRRRPAELVDGERHSAGTDSGPDTSSSRRVSASFTSFQTTVPLLSIRNVPRIGVPRSSSNTS